MRCGHATQRVDGAYAGDPPRQLGIHSAKSTPCRTIVVVVPERSSHLAPHPSPHAVEQPTRLPGPANPHPHPHPHNPASHSQSSSSISSSESLTVVTCSRESSGASIAKLVSSSILGDCDACSWQLGLRGARRGGKARSSAPWRGRPRRAPPETRCTSQSRHGRSGPTFDRAVVPRPRTARVAHRERWLSAPEMRRPPTARALAPAQARPHRVLSRRRWARDAPPLHVPPPLGARTM